jgi:hypothetical protein
MMDKKVTMEKLPSFGGAGGGFLGGVGGGF